MTVTDIETARWMPVAPQGSLGCLPMWRLKKVRTFVDANIDAPLRLHDLACAAGLSRMHFAARFRATTGLRPHDYVLARRIAFAKDQMAKKQGALVHIALDAGFQSQAHFCTVFKRLTGVTPTAWQRQVLAPCGAQASETAVPFATVVQFRRDVASRRNACAA